MNEIKRDDPFIQWMADKAGDNRWSLGACVGYARRNKLHPEEQIPCAKTLYNELWAGSKPISLFDAPEALSRTRKHSHQGENKRVLGKSIRERPEIVSLRKERGHREIDTAVRHRAGREPMVLMIIEKLTDCYTAVKIPGRDADSVMTALKVLREECGEDRFSEVFKTITATTAPNSKDFRSLNPGASVYNFAHPYSSWERAQNERHNRLFRIYVPKEGPIENYSSEQIMWFADEMNGPPRGHLGYATLAELFDEILDQVY